LRPFCLKMPALLVIQMGALPTTFWLEPRRGEAAPDAAGLAAGEAAALAEPAGLADAAAPAEPAGLAEATELLEPPAVEAAPPTAGAAEEAIEAGEAEPPQAASSRTKPAAGAERNRFRTTIPSPG
jgi:hypothetical protein